MDSVGWDAEHRWQNSAYETGLFHLPSPYSLSDPLKTQRILYSKQVFIGGWGGGGGARVEIASPPRPHEESGLSLVQVLLGSDPKRMEKLTLPVILPKDRGLTDFDRLAHTFISTVQINTNHAIPVEYQTIPFFFPAKFHWILV